MPALDSSGLAPLNDRDPVRSRPGGLLLYLLFAVWLAAAVVPAAAQAPSGDDDTGGGNRLVDRIVAVVDEDPILESDLDELVALGLAQRRQGEGDEAFRARLVESLIDDRVRFHAIDRFGFEQVPVELIEQRMAAIRDSFPSDAAYRERLAEVGLGEDELRQLVARQLMVLTYVDERLGARVFVSLDDIRSYYQQELVPALEAKGEPVPPLDEVREPIRALIKEKRLNEEIDRWTEELRLEADVQVFLDQPGELPPVVDTVP